MTDWSVRGIRTAAAGILARTPLGVAVVAPATIVADTVYFAVVGPSALSDIAFITVLGATGAGIMSIAEPRMDEVFPGLMARLRPSAEARAVPDVNEARPTPAPTPPAAPAPVFTDGMVPDETAKRTSEAIARVRDVRRWMPEGAGLRVDTDKAYQALTAASAAWQSSVEPIRSRIEDRIIEVVADACHRIEQAHAAAAAHVEAQTLAALDPAAETVRPIDPHLDLTEVRELVPPTDDATRAVAAGTPVTFEAREIGWDLGHLIDTSFTQDGLREAQMRLDEDETPLKRPLFEHDKNCLAMADTLTKRSTYILNSMHATAADVAKVNHTLHAAVDIADIFQTYGVYVAADTVEALRRMIESITPIYNQCVAREKAVQDERLAATRAQIEKITSRVA